jgi:hypothetical protein
LIPELDTTQGYPSSRPHLAAARVGSEAPRENLCGSRTVASAAGRDLAVDVIASVVLLGGVEIVGAAAQSEICGCRWSALGEWIDVVELELVSRGAAVAGAADEGAPAVTRSTWRSGAIGCRRSSEAARDGAGGAAASGGNVGASGGDIAGRAGAS